MLKFFKDILFPIECLFCKKYGAWICADCFTKLKINDQQSCLHCKKTNATGEFCPTCQENYSFNGVLIAGDYEDQNLAEAIKKYKYSFIEDLGHDLGNFLTVFLSAQINFNLINSNTILMPIPLSKARRRYRGFNQAEVLAKIISTNFNLEISKDLIRPRHKKPQAKLNEAQRKENLKNAFAWAGPDLKNKNIILIDDVVTTGATLNECAKVLKAANAAAIWGLVIAKG
jgi:ComF family protein